MGYPPGQAGQWLRFLAVFLSSHDSRSLAWRHLADRVSRLVRAAAAGLGIGLALGFAGRYILRPAAGLAYGLTFGLATGSAFGCGQLREPSRIEIRFRGKERSLLRRLAASVVVGLGLTPVADPISGLAFGAVFMTG
jgi:hypothetical protein